MGRSRNPRRKPPCHVSAGVTTPVTAASQFRISVILCDYSQIRPSVGLRGGSRSGAYRGSAELRAEAVGCQFVFTTNTARSLAGSVSLALALTRCRSPGSSEKLSDRSRGGSASVTCTRGRARASWGFRKMIAIDEFKSLRGQIRAKERARKLELARMISAGPPRLSALERWAPQADAGPGVIPYQ